MEPVSARNNQRFHLLAPISRRMGHHGRVRHIRVRQQNLLHFRRIHFVSRGSNQNLDPSAKTQHPPILCREIPRVEPPPLKAAAARLLIRPGLVTESNSR
jgi:hypothetical protein